MNFPAAGGKKTRAAWHQESSHDMEVTMTCNTFRVALRNLKSTLIHSGLAPASVKGGGTG
jgi:hypothetical protein